MRRNGVASEPFIKVRAESFWSHTHLSGTNNQLSKMLYLSDCYFWILNSAELQEVTF